MKPIVDGIRAPEFPAMRWLNSPPLRLSDLKGRVLMVDFWSYTCVNSLRALPYSGAWHERYGEVGLVLVGVHAPEFPFAREVENVERSVAELEVRYPVALDNDFHAWQAFHNHYWPARYLFDARGVLRYFHFGEGDYEESERAIQECLSEIHTDPAWPEPLAPLRPEDRPGVVCRPATPELYLGLERGHLGNSETAGAGETRAFELPGRRDSDRVCAQGPWRTELKYLESAGGGPAALHVRYSALEVNLVLAPAGEPIEIELAQDGLPLAAEDRGADASATPSGAAVVRVTHPRLYRLVKNREFGAHDLRVGVDRPGLRAYQFSFVSCADPSGGSAVPAAEAEVRGTSLP